MDVQEKNDVDEVDRVGWFQFQLLLQLAFGPKYGYEIINDLKLTNVRISSGQVYPALKSLVKSGFLKSFSKRGRAARRKYYEITPKGLESIRVFFSSMMRNLFPVMYSYLEDTKITLFKNYKIDRGDKILFYGYPIKQALLDLVQLVGDTGEVLITVSNAVYEQIVEDIAVFYNFEKIMKPVLMKNNVIDCSKAVADKAILMIFQKEFKVESLLKEALRIIKPEGSIIILSTKLNILSESFLSFFEFLSFFDVFDGYNEQELKDLCGKLGLTIGRVENIKNISIIQATKNKKDK